MVVSFFRADWMVRMTMWGEEKGKEGKGKGEREKEVNNSC